MSEGAEGGEPGQAVLVVEDDQAIGNMLTTLLSVEGYRPMLIGDGRSALDAVRAIRPALMTLDLSLPVMDGLQVLDHLRQDRDDADPGARIPIIVVSAYTERLTPVHRSRVAAILTKPFEIESLMRCIRTALGET